MKPIALTLLALTSPAFSADQPAVNLNDHIKPILRQHCLKCHGDDQQKAGLNLQNYKAALAVLRLVSSHLPLALFPEAGRRWD